MVKIDRYAEAWRLYPAQRQSSERTAFVEGYEFAVLNEAQPTPSPAVLDLLHSKS